MSYSTTDTPQLKVEPGGYPSPAKQGLASEFALPLLPLQKRDRKSLVALFEREDMADIHTNIADQLSKLTPEPCWDDDPLNFLSDLF